MKSKRYIFKKRFDGLPKRDDFDFVEEELPSIEAGDVLFESVFLSVDPYMRAYEPRIPIGSTMIGSQISKVIESKNAAYSVGDVYVTTFGWVSHFVFNPDKTDMSSAVSNNPYKLSDFGGLSVSLGLGALGMPGNTAWFGLTKICRPKKGETIVVTGAAGAVGSLVGQIGRNLGLNVIGFTGSDEKVKILKDELKFHHAFNYKTVNVRDALKQAAPNGIDCFFDNVGGRISHEIMLQMNHFGRVALCGAISSYNDSNDDPSVVPVYQKIVVMKELCIEGFIVSRWKKEWFEGIQEMLQLIQEGEILVKETVVEGFDNMFEAFMKLFDGENVGKLLVKV